MYHHVAFGERNQFQEPLAASTEPITISASYSVQINLRGDMWLQGHGRYPPLELALRGDALAVAFDWSQLVGTPRRVYGITRWSLAETTWLAIRFNVRHAREHTWTYTRYTLNIGWSRLPTPDLFVRQPPAHLLEDYARLRPGS